MVGTEIWQHICLQTHAIHASSKALFALVPLIPYIVELVLNADLLLLDRKRLR